jgi:hypothetical protein
VPVRSRQSAGKAVAKSKHRLCISPLKLPLDSARHAPGTARGYSFSDFKCPRMIVLEIIPDATPAGGDQKEQGRPGKGATLSLPSILTPSILLFAHLFAGTLASERGLHALFLTGFQVKGVTLDFLDDVFLLHFALETA